MLMCIGVSLFISIAYCIPLDEYHNLFMYSTADGHLGGF